MGIARLHEDGRPLFAPVFGMIGGIAAVAMANHERLKLPVNRFAQREWRERAERHWDR